MIGNLLKMIKTLESKGIVTKKYLSEKLNVHPRTVQRYRKLLIELGYEISAGKRGYLLVNKEL